MGRDPVPVAFHQLDKFLIRLQPLPFEGALPVLKEAAWPASNAKPPPPHGCAIRASWLFTKSASTRANTISASQNSTGCGIVGIVSDHCLGRARPSRQPIRTARAAGWTTTDWPRKSAKNNGDRLLLRLLWFFAAIVLEARRATEQ